MLQAPIIDNTKRSRFETEIDGEFAYIDYRFYEDDFVLLHTFVPEFARGNGIAMALARFTLENAKEKNLQLRIYCPFIAAYVKRHAEYDSLIHKQ